MVTLFQKINFTKHIIKYGNTIIFLKIFIKFFLKEHIHIFILNNNYLLNEFRESLLLFNTRK